jgi:CBS domain-containing protein
VTQVASEVMLDRPKTLPADASVATVREQLASPKMQMVLLADGPRFSGAVTAIPAEAGADEPALAYADPEPDTIAPDVPADVAFERTVASRHRRVIVVDGDGNLLGLLCLDATRARFCQTPSRASAAPAS